MPLSCKGRYRGTEPSRGDIDDALGNYTLTLVDTLDTLFVSLDVTAIVSYDSSFYTGLLNHDYLDLSRCIVLPVFASAGVSRGEHLCRKFEKIEFRCSRLSVASLDDQLL